MSSPEEIKSLIEKFQETIQKWPKDGGLFIDLMGEKLKQIEQSFYKDVAVQLPPEAFSAGKAKKEALSSTQKEIYIALYQMDGENMERWANILGSISMQGISRPIYENEADVCAMIRSKEHKSKEGYVVMKILSSDVVNSASPLTDRAGRPLLHVKPGSLKPENILRFVQVSGQYLWQHGKLTKLDAKSPININ